jgi:hypothetical protein
MSPEGRCDRSLARSAWASANPNSRSVGYGMIRAGVGTDSTWRPFPREYLWIGYARSYRTLRDGTFEGHFPRHFVPGYDRCCPSGTRTCREVLALSNVQTPGKAKLVLFKPVFVDFQGSNLRFQRRGRNAFFLSRNGGSVIGKTLSR